MPSFYAPQLCADTRKLCITGDEYHHICNVFRHKTGDRIRLNSGNGLLAEAKIESISKKELCLSIVACREHLPPPASFALAFCLLKGKHDELLVEKITELGARDIFPLVSSWSVRKPVPNTLSRFEKITLAAIKQCDNPFLPKVHPVQDLKPGIEELLRLGYKVLACSERQPQRYLCLEDTKANTCFLIGPEGGWSSQEYDLFESLQIPEINLSSLVLRAETAAICAASQWNMLLLSS
ncbi:MAG: RsmE family RNA methyltransferase [Candidatus Cloacimonetes bacterium]|nr:RsmE family RNA methyltransferase [Candidatus Cloacimonadota bacterium]